MPNGIIRIPQGTKLPAELLEILEKNFPGYIPEAYFLKPDYQQSYAKRVDILFHAFEFLLDGYPLSKKVPLSKNTLKKYAEECKAAYVGKSGSAAQLQKELELFTDKIIDAVKLGWNQPSHEAIELLNEAEQYLLMARGRSNLATLTPMNLGNGIEYILQLDETLPPYYDQIINELQQIKSLGYPKTPTWFREFAKPEHHFMQAYFCNLQPGITELVKDFDNFLKYWKDVKGNTKLQVDLHHIAQRNSPLASWFEKLPIHHQEMIRALATSAPYTIDKKLEQFKAILVSLEGKTLNEPWFPKVSNTKNLLQFYFDNSELGPTELLNDFDSFLFQWEEIKLYPKLHSDLSRIVAGYSSPPWFDKLPLRHQELLRTFATSSLSAINNSNIDKDLELFRKKLVVRKEYKDTFNQVLQIPQWYWVLPEHQQYFVQHVLANKTRIEDAVSFLPSRMRTLPMPANFAAHTLYTITGKGEMKALYSPKYRSSHIATRDGLVWPQEVQRRHILANLMKVMQHAKNEQVVLFQTLISPLNIPVLSSIIPDFELDRMARSIVVEGKTPIPPTIQTNHPLNKAKYWLYTKENDPGALALIAAAEDHLHTISDLKKLLKIYEAALNSGRGTSTYKDVVARELFLSSLEQLIILTIEGYSYGSCVSGKDRKAIELIHTDAMFLYWVKYGSWPELADTPINRANFVSLVADVYMTRHQHEHAGENAPGSEGIKNPEEYFPADIAAEINRRLELLGVSHSLALDDRLATNNEVKKIATGSLSEDILSAEDSLLCKLIAIELGEDRCREIYDALYLVFSDLKLFTAEEVHTWKSLFSFFSTSKDPCTPTGIKQIKELMESPGSGANNVARLTGIFSIILARPEHDSSRGDATISVYKGLRQLLKPTDWDGSSERVVKKIVAEWKEMFYASKKEYASTQLVV